MKHFSATKMIIESYLRGPGGAMEDPDDQALGLDAFADVAAAAQKNRRHMLLLRSFASKAVDYDWRTE